MTRKKIRAGGLKIALHAQVWCAPYGQLKDPTQARNRLGLVVREQLQVRRRPVADRLAAVGVELVVLVPVAVVQEQRQAGRGEGGGGCRRLVLLRTGNGKGNQDAFLLATTHHSWWKKDWSFVSQCVYVCQRVMRRWDPSKNTVVILGWRLCLYAHVLVYKTVARRSNSFRYVSYWVVQIYKQVRWRERKITVSPHDRFITICNTG